MCVQSRAQRQYALFLRPWSSFLGWHYWHFPPPSCGPSSHLSWLLLNSQLSFAAVDQWLSTPPVSYWQSKQPSSSKWGPRSLFLSPSIRAVRLLWALGPLLGQSIHHSTHQKCAHFLIGSQLADVCVKKHCVLLSFQKCVEEPWSARILHFSFSLQLCYVSLAETVCVCGGCEVMSVCVSKR